MNNDDKILQLKKQVDLKKRDLTKLKTFSPKTNCILNLDGASNNLNVADIDYLQLLLIRLNSYIISMKDLKINNLIISGYDIKDWISDIKNRIEILSIKQKEKELKVIENKLSGLLSTDKKIELELDDIAKLLID